MSVSQPDAQKALEEVRFYLRAALDWIDALPRDTVSRLPAMPGFDRDKAEYALAHPPAPCPVGDHEPAWRNWVAAQGGNIAADDQCSWESFKAGYEAGACPVTEKVTAQHPCKVASNMAREKLTDLRLIAHDTQGLEKMRKGKDYHHDGFYLSEEDMGWNACLDAIIERSGK